MKEKLVANSEEMKLKQELELKKTEKIATKTIEMDNVANKRFEDLQNEFQSVQKQYLKEKKDMLKVFSKEKEEMIAVYQKEKEDIATIHSKEKEDIINTHLKNIEEMKLKQELELKKMEETIANNKTKLTIKQINALKTCKMNLKCSKQYLKKKGYVESIFQKEKRRDDTV